ncbi:MAG: hypothetical protein SynsKO_21330 [Synoicihabitans sp.]
MNRLPRFPRFAASALGLLLLFTNLASGQNRTLQFSGNFVTAFSTGASNYQGITNFDATWSFLFNESSVSLTETNDQVFEITDVTFNATVQTGFSFTIPDIIAQLVYRRAGGDYELSQVSINGAPQGANLVDGTSDDFSFGYQSLSDFGSITEGYSGIGDADSILLSRAGRTGSQSTSADDGSFSVSVSAVPEPASASILFGALALGFTVSRRRRR